MAAKAPQKLLAERTLEAETRASQRLADGIRPARQAIWLKRIDASTGWIEQTSSLGAASEPDRLSSLVAMEYSCRFTECSAFPLPRRCNPTRIPNYTSHQSSSASFAAASARSLAFF